MKNLKKTMAILGTLGIIASSTAAYAVTATTIKTPTDIISNLTGKTTTQLITERATGKTYGTIAKEAGKLTEFQTQMLAQKKAILDQRVKDKTLTQAQADAIYNTIKANQGTCNGTGSAAIGKKNGLGMGYGQGQRNGMGIGKGAGNDIRNGSGCRMGSACGMSSGIGTN